MSKIFTRHTKINKNPNNNKTSSNCASNKPLFLVYSQARRAAWKQQVVPRRA